MPASCRRPWRLVKTTSVARENSLGEHHPIRLEETPPPADGGGMASCAGCRRENAPGVALCAFCGRPLGGAAAAPPAERGKLWLLLGLLVVAVGLWRFSPFKRNNPESDCQGGASVEVIWKTADAHAPRIALPNVHQIDPQVTPFVELAKLRSTGTRRYGQNNDRQPRHLHQGVVDGLHAAGANAYFHQPSR